MLRKAEGVFVRTEKSSWQELADYIHDHTEAEFSHGLCDECLEKYNPESDEADDDENFAALGKIIGETGKSQVPEKVENRKPEST